MKGAAARAYPGYAVAAISNERNPDQAVTVSLKAGTHLKSRLFNPYTGANLGDSVPLGIWMVSKLQSLHDDLLGGETGRKVNGAGAILVIVLALTGIVVWWPGIRTWRRSLTVHRNVGWRRFIWDLHGMMGFWKTPWVRFVVPWDQQGPILWRPAAVSGPGRPDRALHCRQRRGAHGGPDYLLARLPAFRQG